MASFAPQLVKIWREKEAAGISLGMYSVTATGFALWTAYGLFIGRWPIAASNAICLVLSTAVLALAIRFKRQTKTGSRAAPPSRRPSGLEISGLTAPE
jgi:MtN3 and saliva related transmembrane protein